MDRVRFTFTARCPERDYDLYVNAQLEAPAPECGDPGGWRVTSWAYRPAQDWRGDRNFFAETRTAASQVSFISEEGKRVRDEYNHVSYPEDIREHKELRLFQDTFKEYSPVRKPESEDDWETEEYQGVFENANKKESTYGRKSDFFKTVPLSRDEDKRGANDGQ